MALTRRTVITIAGAAGLICLGVYLRALSCGFVNWEDQDYVLNNEAIRSLDRNFFGWAFTTMPLGFWFPLTWLSFAVDYRVWGLNPTGYHLTNILLHAANTGLVVLIADALYSSKFGGTETPSRQRYLYPGMLILAGLLFGIHPARVESVAWVTERKDVLNGLFTFGAIVCYLRYVKKREGTPGQGSGYGLYSVSLILFLFSLMAKPSSVVLPALLLVLDWYPLGRLRKGKMLAVMVEKVPFLAIAGAVTAVTVVVGAQGGYFNQLSDFPLGARMIASGNALFEYFLLMLYPVRILPYYDLPWPLPQSFALKAAAALVLIGCCIFWGRKRPWIAAAMIAFVIPHLPTLHIFAAGWQLTIASRYTYLPSLVPSIIVAALAASAYQKWGRGQAPYGGVLITCLLVLGLLFYASVTQKLIGVWKDSGAMWSRVIEYQPFDRAYFYRGLYYTYAGNYNAAILDYSTCLAVVTRQRNEEAMYNVHAFRGEALIKAGRFEEAVLDFDAAITSFPHRLYFYHRALALQGLGKIKEANEDFKRAGRAKGEIYWFPMGSPV